MTKSVWLASIIVITAVSAMTWAYEAFQGPTELIQYDPDKAFEGYTMFGAQSGENVYLIDMQGQVVHMWPVPEDWAPISLGNTRPLAGRRYPGTRKRKCISDRRLRRRGDLGAQG